MVMVGGLCRGVTRMGDLAAPGKKSLLHSLLPWLALIRAGKVQRRQYDIK